MKTMDKAKFTMESLTEQARRNAEALAIWYRPKIEAAERLPEHLRSERFAEIERAYRTDLQYANAPLIEMAKLLPPSFMVFVDGQWKPDPTLTPAAP